MLSVTDAKMGMRKSAAESQGSGMQEGGDMSIASGREIWEHEVVGGGRDVWEEFWQNLDRKFGTCAACTFGPRLTARAVFCASRCRDSISGVSPSLLSVV